MRFIGSFNSNRYSSGISRLELSSRRFVGSKKTVSQQNSLNSIFEKHNQKNPLSNITTNTYDKIKTGAKNLSEHINKLSNTQKGNLFDGKEKTDKVITDEIKGFVSDFNALISTMRDSGNDSYKGYAQEMKNQLISIKDKLADIGITYNKDGSLGIDTKQLETVDINKLKSLFQGKDSPMTQVSEKASYIEKRVGLDKIISAYDTSQLNGFNLKV